LKKKPILIIGRSKLRHPDGKVSKFVRIANSDGSVGWIFFNRKLDREVRKMRSRRSICVGKKIVKPYRVYYAKNPVFLPSPELKRSNLGETHLWLKDFEAENLEDVFQKMQAEVWSPNGETRELILSKGLSHTSMSVGDVVYDVKADRYFEVDMIGFREIT